MNPYAEALIEYLVFFHADRDYFECHEIMEAHWKKETGSRYSAIWLGLIQVAVSLYHHRRGNRAGARKMMEEARRNLENEPLHEVGIDGPLLLERIRERCALLNSAENALFSDLNIPLLEPLLEQACRALCAHRHVIWLSPSPVADTYIVNKHTLRDRSEVIRERAGQLQRKRGNTP